MRTLLTLLALATVVMLVFVVVGFIRGLEKSLSVSGDPDVVLVYSVTAEDNIENSAIAARTPSLLAASLGGTAARFGVNSVSPELYLGTRVVNGKGQQGFGLIRGVTISAPLVRRTVKITAGAWPKAGEVMVGRLASAKLGSDKNALAIGESVEFEGQQWKISGHFAAGGAAYESEIWGNLADFQTATKRQDISLVAMVLAPGSSPAEVELFCFERTDLELQAVREMDYYKSLQKHYTPVRWLAWFVVILVSSAGVFAGLNMMYGAVAGRVQEIATLRAIGFRRRAILLSILQEGALLSVGGSLLSGFVALVLLNGLAVRFTMGAFTLRIDGIAILIGCAVGLMLGVLGALPPAIKALRASVAASLRAV